MSNQIPSRCGDAGRMRSLLEGALPQDEHVELEEHLETCDACRRALDRAAAAGSFWDDVHRFAAPLAETTRLTNEPDDDAEPLGFLEPDDTPGRLGRFGRYEVLDVVGRGGMGIVLKAFDSGLHRLVAIKVLSPRLATSASARKRFLREARAAASVAHEHVVTIHAVDEANGLPYLVMHYVAGRSLEERIDRDGPLELEAILRIGMQTAAGLAAAHAQGLVHRDVKPANILLENGIERVKITDFGLARAVDDASLTQSGIVAGTPQYMAPEQARAETVDHRADLFSLGSVLYAMCTGRSPFRAESTVAVLKRVCDDTPRPIPEVNPSIPAWLAEIVARLHAKSPDDRLQSATEVAEQLGRHLARLQQPPAAAAPELSSGTVPAPAATLDIEFAALPGAKAAPPYKTHRRAIGLAAAIFVTVVCILGMSQTPVFSRVSDFLATVLRIPMRDGTLVIEVDDPQIRVDVDGEAVAIRGAGLEEIRLHPGPHKLQATRDGTPIFAEIIRINRGEKQTVRVQFEPAKTGPLLASGDRRSDPNVAVDRQPDGAHPSIRTIVPSQSESRGDHSTLRARIALVQTMRGHDGSAKSVAISPDGRYALSGSGYPTGDATARLWDLATGSEVRRFGTSAMGQVLGVAFSPDGRRALTCGQSTAVLLWDIATGRELGRLEGHSGAVNAVAFSPDGHQAVSAGIVDAMVRMWDLDTGREIRHLEGHTAKVFCVAYSSDGRSIVSGSEDRTVRVWDATTGQVIRTLPGMSRSAESVAFSPDGHLILAAGQDGVAWLWDVETGRIVHQLAGHQGIISSVSFVPGTGRALTASPGYDQVRSDGALRLWDVRTGTEIARIGNPAGAGFLSVAAAPDGQHAITGGTDGSIQLWRLPNPDAAGDARGTIAPTAMPGEVAIMRGHSNWSEAVAVPADRRFALSAGNDFTLRRWDLSTGSETRKFELQAAVSDVAVTDDGRFAVTGSLDHVVTFWDVESGRRVPLLGHERKVRAVAISRDGRFALSGAEENELRFWDLAHAKELRRLGGHTRGTCSVAISPDGHLGLSGSVDGTARLWDLEKGSCRRVLVEGGPWVTAVAFMPDSRHAIVGRQDGILSLYAVDDGREIRRFAGHGDYIRNVQASRDGQLILSAGSGVLRLWNAVNGDEVYQLRGVGGGIVCGIILPGSQEVLVGCYDTTVRLWRLPTKLGKARVE